jgi:hypothetical protein
MTAAVGCQAANPARRIVVGVLARHPVPGNRGPRGSDRRLICPGRLLLVALLALPLLLLVPAPADATPVVDACPHVPLVHVACKAVTGAVEGGASGGPAGAVTGATGAVVGSLGSGWVKNITDGATWILKKAHDGIMSTTNVNLSNPWFVQHYLVMASECVVIVLLLLLLSTIGSVVRVNGRELARSWALLPIVFFSTVSATYFVQCLVALFDWMSAGTGKTIGADFARFIHDTQATFSAAGSATGLPVIWAGIAAVVLLFGGFLVWIDRLLRAEAIYIVSYFLPFILALLLWEPVRKWVRRSIEILVVVIASWFVTVSIISLGLSALAHSPTAIAGGTLATLFIGAAMMILAVFMPLALIKSLGFMEAQVQGAMAHRRDLKQASGAQRAGEQSRQFVQSVVHKSTASGGAGKAAAITKTVGGAATGGTATVISLAAEKAAKATRDRAAGQPDTIHDTTKTRAGKDHK